MKVLATAMVFFCHSYIVCYETFNYSIHGFYRIFITPAWGGVWIFLVLGGFLAAHGFYRGKYNLHMGGVKMYYTNRIVKILIPTWIFISLAYVLIYQERTPALIEMIQYLTCTFNAGSYGLPGIGASWYVFIVMWCYLLAPLIIWILNKLEVYYQGKELSFYLISFTFVSLLGGLYRVFSFFYLDWYNWTYANVLGCLDLFAAGIITYRMIAFLPELSNKRIRLIRIFTNCGLLALILVCIGQGYIPYGILLQKYVWPSAYLILTCAILVLYSYKIDENYQRFPTFWSVCNTIAPYTFTYYLWHSFMLMYVAAQLKIENDDLHFLLTIVVGAIASSYVAFLMTKMNTGIIKALLRL